MAYKSVEKNLMQKYDCINNYSMQRKRGAVISALVLMVTMCYHSASTTLSKTVAMGARRE